MKHVHAPPPPTRLVLPSAMPCLVLLSNLSSPHCRHRSISPLHSLFLLSSPRRHPPIIAPISSGSLKTLLANTTNVCCPRQTVKFTFHDANLNTSLDEVSMSQVPLDRMQSVFRINSFVCVHSLIITLVLGLPPPF
jgi:hypothetical protein